MTMARVLILAGACALMDAQCASAAIIPVPNGGFEDYTSVGTTSSSWLYDNLRGSPLPAQIPSALTPNHYPTEFWAGSATFGSGWSYTLNGNIFSSPPQVGTDHPSDTFYPRLSDGTSHGRLLGGDLAGEFIGYMNLRNDSGSFSFPVGAIQSGILGQLSASGGGYTVQVTIGSRPGNISGGALGWEDVRYDLSLVVDPIASGGGSSGGTVLGVPASAVIAPSSAVFGSNTAVLTYSLALNTDDPAIGHDFAIPLVTTDTGLLKGAPSPPGFTQANFDNFKVFDTPGVPEPVGLGMLAVAGLAMKRRRRHAAGCFGPSACLESRRNCRWVGGDRGYEVSRPVGCWVCAAAGDVC